MIIIRLSPGLLKDMAQPLRMRTKNRGAAGLAVQGLEGYLLALSAAVRLLCEGTSISGRIKVEEDHRLVSTGVD
jgi:hypothetical protein